MLLLLLPFVNLFGTIPSIFIPMGLRFPLMELSSISNCPDIAHGELHHIYIRSFSIDVLTYYDLSWLLVTNLFRPMLPSLILKILDFIVHKTSRGNSRILFLSQRPDLLSWLYVYLLDFALVSNLIHHLALYQISVRTLERIATPLPPSSTSLLMTCGSLHLAVTTCGWFISNWIRAMPGILHQKVVVY